MLGLYLFRWIAPFYDRLFRPPDPSRLQNLLHLPISGWLLDVGGGTGRVSYLLRDQVSRIVVLDESAEMLAQARAKGLSVVHGRAERAPFRDEAFACVLMVDALHHMAEPRQALAELCRLLAPPDQSTGASGGRLLIEEPNIRRCSVKLIAFAERLLLMRSRFLSAPDILALLADCPVRAEVLEDGATLWIVVERRA